ncbi:MAG TPA: hypothetical protein DCL29_06875 [Eubacterium sp.]|nr:hypothetical protein [Eubacterium sp.]
MNNYQSIATINAPEFINLEPLDINPMMSKCEIKVLYLGENRNGTSINKEAASSMAKTLRGAPIVGYYKTDKQDFFDHGEQIIYDGEGVHFNTLTKPYGFVSPDADVWFQEFEEFNEAGESTTRTYMMTTGYLWTGQFQEAQQIFNEGGKGQSMELDENSLSGFWSKEANSDMEFFIINDAVFSKLCILGDDVEPCFEGSSITAPNISKTFSLDDNFKRTLFSMMKELQYTLQGGTEKVEDEKKKSVDSSAVTEETPVVEESEKDESQESQTESVVEDNNQAPETDTTDAPAAEDGDNGTESGESEGSDSSNDGSSDYVKKEDEKDEESDKEDDSKEEDSEAKEDDDEDKKKEDKYALLLVQFEELQKNNAALTEQIAETTKALEHYINAEKDALINEFYMLSDEDKKDVIDHKTEYSLDEIKSKLAVLCYDKKVSYSQEEAHNDVDMTVNVDAVNSELPTWLEAVEQHRNQ